jgi:hypothetical protein
MPEIAPETCHILPLFQPPGAIEPCLGLINKSFPARRIGLERGCSIDLRKDYGMIRPESATSMAFSVHYIEPGSAPIGGESLQAESGSLPMAQPDAWRPSLGLEPRPQFSNNSWKAGLPAAMSADSLTIV